MTNYIVLGSLVVKEDEHPRHGTKIEKLLRLKPAFKNPGSVTAGNSSGINDGAAAVMLMNASTAMETGLTPMARVVTWAQAGVDPQVMGTGPIPAIRVVVRFLLAFLSLSHDNLNIICDNLSLD